MKANCSSLPRALRVESLENRQLMAGDVMAQFSNGTLSIVDAPTNQGQASDIYISKLSNGAIRVGAAGNTGNLVNGKSYVDFFKVVPTTNLSVRLGDGNDRLTLVTPMTVNQVDINMGRAQTIVGDNDTVNISGLTTLNQLNITTGDGTDEVSVTKSRIGDGLGGIGGASDQLKILTGKGSDTVTIGDLNNQMSVKGYVFVDTTSGPMNLARNQSELGEDKVAINLLTVDGSIDVNLGGGKDKLDMVAVTTGNRVVLWSGEGDDVVNMRDTVARNGLEARMGAGNDKLNMFNVDTIFGGGMYLDGGDGPADKLYRSLDSTTNYFQAFNWE